MNNRPLLVTLWRRAIMLVVSFYLLLPLIAMLDFSTKVGRNMRGLYAWRAILHQPDLVSAIITSLELALIVVGLVLFVVVPTVVWVHLKLPKLRRTLELVCLLPLAIPGIVLVVGVAEIYRWISIHLTESPLTLATVYAMLVLPYTYRSLSAALNAVDVHTLAEAARTLGASTFRMLFGVVVPTIRAGVMSGAVISIALVLGEFTISSLLNYKTMQVQIVLLGQSDASIAVAVSLASLLFVFLLLVIIPTSKRVAKILDSDE
ncbi:MAG: ABC transporter permease subunit [Candidatus Nanopelagicaceae bacterium]|nr:ABC transporter permease subunit [Candidatus Nanopelagicaceae bacterium]